jgi:hypothetical protein
MRNDYKTHNQEYPSAGPVDWTPPQPAVDHSAQQDSKAAVDAVVGVVVGADEHWASLEKIKYL